MLKVLAILTLAFFVVPVHADAQTDKANEATHSSYPTSPASTPIIPKQTYGQTLQPKTGEHISGEIGIVSTPEKNGYDWFAYWASIVLVGVGIGGIVVAICTLIKIERQTAATEKQVQHIVATERAWMIPRIRQPKEDEFIQAAKMEDGWLFPIEVVFTNRGNTPALAIRAVMDCTSERIAKRSPDKVPTLILELKEPREYENAVDRYAPGSFYISRAKTYISWGVSKSLIVEEMPLWSSGTKCLCVKGYIEYIDAFKETRISRFCYAYQCVSVARATQYRLKGMQPPVWEFRKCGPDTYNEID
jgi:hypothetical protein